MKDKFKHFSFKEESKKIIKIANEIIYEYAEQGFQLTLRQLYYQFVARGIIENSVKSYKRLGLVVNHGRLAGLIDWEAIIDRTRNLEENDHYDGPGDIIECCIDWYRIDKWADQTYRVEVWIEKEALVGIVEKICQELDVAFFACRGYVSQSEQYKAGQRFADYACYGQRVAVIHLGDHDPSGMDMTNDNDKRLNMFARDEVELNRIALNMDQVKKYNPPPNPAKLTDTRCREYIRQFGPNSWELDALDPMTLQSLIISAVESYRDDDTWDAVIKREADERKELALLSNNYNGVKQFLAMKETGFAFI